MSEESFFQLLSRFTHTPIVRLLGFVALSWIVGKIALLCAKSIWKAITK
mgnify:CR=1 FL=1